MSYKSAIKHPMLSQQKILASVWGSLHRHERQCMGGMPGNREQTNHKQVKQGTYSTCKNSCILSYPVFIPHPAPQKNMFESSRFKPLIWQPCQHHGAPAAPKRSQSEAWISQIASYKWKPWGKQWSYISATYRHIINLSNLTHQVPFQPLQPEL